MSGTDVDEACATCGALAPGRFCGRCGALVRRREPAEEFEPLEATLDAPAGDDETGGTGDADDATAPPGRYRTAVLVVVAVLLVVTLAVAALVRPSPEVVTADGVAGPDGSHRTSTRAVTDLVARWDVPLGGMGGGFARSLGAGIHDLGRMILLTTGTETIAVAHPDRLGDLDGRDAATTEPTEFVLWRSGAISGIPRPVGDRLPVIAGEELLWLGVDDGTIATRHPLEGGGSGVWGPAFAVPAGDGLVTPDGTSMVDHEGMLRWRAGESANVVGVTDDVVILSRAEGLSGRDLSTGEEAWSLPAGDSHVGAALAGSWLVTTEAGGRVNVRDPVSGEITGSVRVGPAPANGPPSDGETTLVGTGDDEVVVRVDTGSGPRYARVAVPSAELADDLSALGGRDVRHIVEQGGNLIVGDWRTVEVMAPDGSSKWTSGDLTRSPGFGDGWIAIGTLEGLRLLHADGTPTSVLVKDAIEVFRHRPVVVDGRVVVLGGSGVVGHELASGEQTWERPLPWHVCCPSHFGAGHAVVVAGELRVVAADGTVRWEEPSSPPGEEVLPSLVGVTGPWLVTSTFGGWEQPSESRLRAVEDGRQGPVLDVSGGLTQVVTDSERLYGLAAEGNQTSIVAFDLPSVDGATVGVIDPKWRQPTADGVQLVATGGELLAVGAAGVRHFDAATGEPLRHTALSLGLAPAAVEGDWLVRRVDAQTLEGINLVTGDTWTYELAAAVSTAPTVAGDLVYVADVTGEIIALRVSDGSVVATVTAPDPVQSLTVAGGMLLAGTESRLYAYGPAGGGVTPTAVGSGNDEIQSTPVTIHHRDER